MNPLSLKLVEACGAGGFIALRVATLSRKGVKGFRLGSHKRNLGPRY